jgi:hypothetical protein
MDLFLSPLKQNWGVRVRAHSVYAPCSCEVSLSAKLCNPPIDVRHGSWQQPPPAQSPGVFEGKSQLLRVGRESVTGALLGVAVALLLEASCTGTNRERGFGHPCSSRRSADVQRPRMRSGYGSRVVVVDAMRRARAACGRIALRLCASVGQRQ